MTPPSTARLQTFGFLVKDVARLSTRNFQRHAGELGLTMPQCKVLAYLARHEGTSQIRLAEMTETEPMTLVRILDRMEADGWLERRAHESDRRCRQLYLKPAAKPIVDKIWDVAAKARGEALAGLSATERERLMDLLAKVHANLTEATSQPPEEKPAAPKKRVA